MWKLPNAIPARMSQIPLVGTSVTGRKTKFDLSELLNYRAQTINTVINLSIKEYLDTQSYNNTTDVAGALTDSGVNITIQISAHFPNLNDMISRRHNIVHQADRDVTPGRGHHAIKSMTAMSKKLIS